MDRRTDIAVALCVALLGIFILVTAQGIHKASVPDPIGSKGAPTLVGVLLAIGGTALVLRRVLRWNQEGPVVASEGVEDDVGVPPGLSARALSIWACAVVYTFALPFAGYLIATPLFIAAVLWLFSLRGWAMLVGVPIGFTIPVFLVFVELLNVRLPTGVLQGPLRQMGLV